MASSVGWKFCIQQFFCLTVVTFIFTPPSAISQKDGDVKLVNGPASYKGTVAVFHNNTWGTICDDSWGRNDASVICRQMGHVRAENARYNSHYGPGPGQILVDQIQCPSDASHILSCTPKMSDWGKRDLSRRRCTHDEDAGVDCVRKTPRVKPNDMPLQLRCPEFVQSGSCKNCSNLKHAELSSCTNKSVVEGVVFARYNGVWSPVSGEGFGEKEANVVCNELGYSLSFPSPPLSELWSNWDGGYCTTSSVLTVFGEGSGASYTLLPATCTVDETLRNDAFRASLQSTLLRSVDCEGNERRLLDCYFSEFGPRLVTPVNVATVRCGFRPHPACNSTCNGEGESCKTTERYRLRGGLYPWTGRVEVYADNKWWTVCSRDWDFAEANIVCRALGYGSAKSFNARHGRGIGSILYTSLKCTGEEATLANCTDKATGYAAEACGHRLDAGVECHAPQTCAISEGEEMSKFVSVRLTKYPYNVNDFVSVKGPQGWGIVCSDSVNARAANVLCRTSRQMFGTRVRSAAITGSHIYYNGSMNCTGSEMSLKECNVSLVQQRKCKNLEAVLDCTQGMPDLVPDLDTLYRSIYYYPYASGIPMDYLSCALDEDCLSSSAYGAPHYSNRFLLRFSSLTMNWGTTDFQPYRGRHEWEWHSCHRHFHSFETFIHYDLLDVTTGAKAAEGHKASFCLEDSLCKDGGYPRFRCSSSQGISPNCGDLYGSHLDCQWIDITDVPRGTYILRLHVNPEFLIAESDYENNMASCRITIVPEYHYRRVTTEACWLSDH